MEDKRTQIIDNLFNKITNLKQIHECNLYIEDMKGEFSYKNVYGEREMDSPFVIASITKLFTTTCILAMKDKGLLSLEDKISNYFNDEIMKGLHVYNGVDYSYDLTISNLLFQTSGLPDYFEEGVDSIKKKFILDDVYFEFNKKIEMVKKLKPHFALGTLNRAYYSDINFDLLGEIIEAVLGMPLEEAYRKYIFEPLNLKNTYLPTKDDFIPSIYYKDKIINRPKTLLSSRASGGAISTTDDLMIFIKSFFSGKLFNKDNFYELKKYNKLQASMGPIYYGGGFMQIPLEGLYTLYMGKGELVGHSGTTGSFAFYFPLKDIFITGNINQAADQALPIRFIMKLAFGLKD